MIETVYSEQVIDAIHDKFNRYFMCVGGGPVYIKISADRPLNHGHLYVVLVRLGMYRRLRYQYRVAIDDWGIVHTMGRRIVLSCGDQ